LKPIAFCSGVQNKNYGEKQEHGWLKKPEPFAPEKIKNIVSENYVASFMLANK
jgi:hypothetical protein